MGRPVEPPSCVVQYWQARNIALEAAQCKGLWRVLGAPQVVPGEFFHKTHRQTDTKEAWPAAWSRSVALGWVPIRLVSGSRFEASGEGCFWLLLGSLSCVFSSLLFCSFGQAGSSLGKTPLARRAAVLASLCWPRLEACDNIYHQD